MSSYGEDIIRETFEKFGDAIGVQMQMPDAMITNLGAMLQAQIDLLAELQSTGRLLADDEMRLTAEQVEDVEALVATANPYSAPADRLRALFPATEPAEPAASEGVNCGANSVVLGWCKLTARHEGLHTNGTYFWGQAPAPAEPAEEETKAGPWTVQLPEGMTTEQRIESLPDEAPGLLAAVREVRERLGISSPVVPAPTETEGGVIEVPDGRGIEVGEALKQIAAAQMAEVARKAETGPWQRIEDVPEGVLQIKDRHGRTWLMVGGTWRFEWHDGNWHEPHTNINAQAPFVAAAEEG